jgi:hypothetical protein
LLREDELVVFRGVLRRLGAAEAGRGLFAVVSAARDDDLLGVDFFTAGPGRLDDVALGADLFAGALAAVPSDGLELAFDMVSLDESRDFCFER